MRYFKLSEFDSPDNPGSGSNMQLPLLVKLDYARALAGIPFVITSGYRTRSHNRKVGGVSNSSHLTGWAVDISAPGSATKYKIVEAALQAGFTRIGIGENFVHVDDDPDKVKNLVWTY
ncbi:MAG TPA: D-Ala-D-Ala carboxypeptidase family metallohydrolase [Pricia sp.]|nr:D-Ala-D-Ala carboxypeptidase family metallohydrolase [Pricia sp.]